VAGLAEGRRRRRRSKTFYIIFAAGIAFIIIGIASVIYSNTAVDVRLDGTVKPGMTDLLTPDMNSGNTAHIIISGSQFNVTITDPSGQRLVSENKISEFNYNYTAKSTGEYKIEIKNIGNSDTMISGHAQTKGSQIEIGGQLMLIVTGIIIIGLSLRFSNR
jgi:hypothetical protein